MHGWQGSWEQQIQEFARRGHKSKASSGAQSEAQGHQQHPGPEKQDSQHKLNVNQPRESFPAKTLRPAVLKILRVVNLLRVVNAMRVTL